MGDKEYRLKCINEIKNLRKHKKTSQKEELLELFTTYVYLTNPDYKYNETYLKDMIHKFFIDIEKYNLKVNFRDEILDKVQKINIPNNVRCQIIIQIDDTWEVKFNNIYEDTNDKWIRTITEIPKLNFVDNNKTYVKCQFNNKQGSVFSDCLVSDDNVKLINFVIEYIKVFIDRLED